MLLGVKISACGGENETPQTDSAKARRQENTTENDTDERAAETMIVIGFDICENEINARHTAAKKLRNRLLADCCNIADPENIISLTPKGRPIIAAEDVDISVSHSSCAVMVGVCFADGRSEARDFNNMTVRLFKNGARHIGVDIEEIGAADRCERYEKTAEKYFLPHEIERLKKIKDAELFTDEFFRMWTVKESICKMTGEGLAGLRRADSFSGSDDRLIYSEKISLGGRAYYASVCSE